MACEHLRLSRLCKNTNEVSVFYGQKGATS
nr:MAG TPA: hypothetical protein [Caudoviricetes sp.]DAR33127.1 MAG TPA: hypothetical protein [Caudoviricetes sp.]